MIRVLIADDHAIVRKGLVEIIRESSETVMVDEACNGVEALDKRDLRQDSLAGIADRLNEQPGDGIARHSMIGDPGSRH